MAERRFDRDLYDLLGVMPTASPAEITSAYRRRARELHPDSGGGDRAHDAAGFVEVLTAYHVLRDPEQRASYDATRERPARRGAPAGPLPIPIRYVRSAPPPSPCVCTDPPVRLNASSPDAPAVSRAGRGEPRFSLLDVIEAMFRTWWW